MSAERRVWNSRRCATRPIAFKPGLQVLQTVSLRQRQLPRMDCLSTPAELWQNWLVNMNRSAPIGIGIVGQRHFGADCRKYKLEVALSN